MSGHTLAKLGRLALVGIAAIGTASCGGGEETPALVVSAPAVDPDASRLVMCAQHALGGESMSRAPSTFVVSLSTTPTGVTKGALPTVRTIKIAFPDRFKRVVTSERPLGRPPAIEIMGFVGSRPFRGMSELSGRVADAEIDERLADSLRADFARYVLAWFVGSTQALPIDLSMVADSAAASQGIRVLEATNVAENFRARLFVDGQTCLPAKLSFERSSNTADAMRDRARGVLDGPAVRTETLVLDDYRRSGALMFPHTQRSAVDGVEMSVLRVLEIETNRRLSSGEFSARP